ncbi:MAG TPA: tetratricopeptide repeat protein [Polyangiaceae bacterium]|nr:tetratricopeptide repeat protein [Polyangiaceae bacterium]
MSPLHQLARASLMLATMGLALGCAELRGRSHAREGNRLYKSGDYAAAIAEYTQAERLAPELATVVLNKGLACRQLLLPGSKGPETERGTRCALEAFARFKAIRPDDPRGEQLYVQTLFDTDSFEALLERYHRQLRSNPSDTAAVNALIQVYSRKNDWKNALEWMVRRAELEPRDADAHYAVGVFIWTTLFQKGGSADKAAFDPRVTDKQVQAVPLFGVDDIAGQERIRLADRGIEHLQRALELRPNYREAMIYLNLLHRQKSFAFFERQDQWQASVDAAETWRAKAAEGGGPAVPPREAP